MNITDSFKLCPARVSGWRVLAAPTKDALNSCMGWQQPLGSFNSASRVIFQKSSEVEAVSVSQLLLFLDAAPGYLWHSAFVINPTWYYHVPSTEHERSGVLAFADGHAETHRWQDAITLELGKTTYENHLQNFSERRDLDWLLEHATVKR